MEKEFLAIIIKELEFWKVVKSNGCWELKLRTDGKYSCVQIKRIKYRAHRIAAAYYLGLNYDDENEYACHKNECNNPKCWNPEHLYVGNATTNSLDALNLGRTNWNAEKTHCKNGHEFTKQNTYIGCHGERNCRICKSNWDKAYRKRKGL